MARRRSEKETAQIRELCAMADVDPTHMLENSHLDLLAAVDTLRMIRAARAAMDSRRI